MFSPEQKKFIYDNSVKVNDQDKYIKVMAYFDDYFKKTKARAVKQYIEFIIILLIIVYIACNMLLLTANSFNEIIFKASAIFVGSLLIYKLGSKFLKYIDHSPVIEKIQKKECDLLCYVGDLTDVSKTLNYGSSSAIQNYFMTVSGNKFQIDRKNYKILEEHKGKKIYLYYFAELLNRQMYITDSSVIFVEE